MENQPVDQLDTHFGAQEDLPGAGGILAMGIISLPFFGGLIGLILSIMTLVKSGAAIKSYNLNPAKYTEKSIKRVRAGRVCAIVSLSLLGTTILIIIGLAAAGAI